MLVGVWYTLPMLGPCAQCQRHATACCAYRPTFIYVYTHTHAHTHVYTHTHISLCACVRVCAYIFRTGIQSSYKSVNASIPTGRETCVWCGTRRELCNRMCSLTTECITQLERPRNKNNNNNNNKNTPCYMRECGMCMLRGVGGVGHNSIARVSDTCGARV